VVYSGFVLQPEARPEKRHRCCPHCGWGPASREHRYASSDTCYYFRCGGCIDPNVGQPSTWKEIRFPS